MRSDAFWLFLALGVIGSMYFWARSKRRLERSLALIIPTLLFLVLFGNIAYLRHETEINTPNKRNLPEDVENKLDVDLDALTTIMEPRYRLRCSIVPKIENLCIKHPTSGINCRSVTSEEEVCTRHKAHGIEAVYRTLEDCSALGVLGDCIDKVAAVAALDSAKYAFNSPDQMAMGDTETIALVVDSSGDADFPQELRGLPGRIVTSTTPVSLQMEAQLIGPAFEIKPKGRRRLEMNSLNPTRWDWTIKPLRAGEHQIEVALYVILTKDEKKISEEKSLSKRQFINVTVTPIDRVTVFIGKIDPIGAFIATIAATIAAILAWFGIKSRRDFSPAPKNKLEPQQTEITAKSADGKALRDEGKDDRKPPVS